MKRIKSPAFWLAGLLLFMSSVLFEARATDTTYHSVVRLGKITGKQLSWKNGQNEYFYFYEYNDRGRGPVIQSHIKTNEQGIIIFQEISGVDYFKTPVPETFMVKNRKAYWKNKFENDSSVFNNEIYSNINGAPAESELMLQMLQKSNGKLNVLPAGNRSAKRIHELELSNEDGKMDKIQLFAFTGFGGPPQLVWFRNNGKFFAAVSNWVSIIEKGYETKSEQLLQVQQKFDNDFYADLAKQNIIKPSNGLAIRNVDIFDSYTGKVSNDQTVLVSGNKIIRKGASQNITIPAGYKIIEGKGKMLLPGLWEMHAHFFESAGPFMLAQGVTNLRDMGNGAHLWKLKNKVEKDSILGPDISVTSGFIDKAGEFAAPAGALVNSLEEGLRYIDTFKMQGCQQIKLYSSLNPEWIKPLAAKAHQLGMRVCGHIPAFMTANQAIDAGYDEITHMNMLMLNFFGDTVDTRNMTRFKLVGKKGFNIDMEGVAVNEFIKKLKDKNIVVDPTMGIFGEMFTQMPGMMADSYKPISSFLPAEIKRNAMTGGFIDADSLARDYGNSYANMKKMLKKLYDAGITIVAGTDGGILQHELEIYSSCGIPNAEVLRMATWWPAKVSGLSTSLGSIEEGKTANMILVNGNPLKNMEDIRKIEWTIKQGNLYSPAKIYSAFGWGYFE